MPSLITTLQCLDCGHEVPFDPALDRCPACDSAWLEAAYDFAAAGDAWRSGLANRPTSLWRYAELLPVVDPAAVVTMGEGWTPLTAARGLGRELGHSQIYIKDERQSPTGSFKDRQGALTVATLVQQGITECVLASTGNKAAAYAAFCARAGIRLWIFLTSTVPAEKLRELALYGAEVVKITGTYDQAKKVAQDFAARRGLYYDKGSESIPGREAFKTIAFEIAEQLGALLAPNGDGTWRAPDWYVQAMSGGIGPLGVWKGFQELKRMGLIDRLPRLALIQSDGCAPMASAWEAGQEEAAPVVPHTRITVLSTGSPGRSYPLLRAACQATGGTMIAVSDGDAFRAMRRMARVEGLSMEPAAAVAFAGLERLLADGTIQPDETVVVNCSGHTFPAEKHILEDQYVLDLEFGEQGSEKHTQLEEGLGAALERLDEQVTTVVVIDDNPQDSRLIRRLLQAHRNYRVFEVNNPLDAIDLVRQRRPDLVMLDLTMPELDGFTLLEQFKADAEIASIPVVVVSAKALTPADRARLEGRAESLWQKGSFNTRELVDHVVRTLGSDPAQDADGLIEATNGQFATAPKPTPDDHGVPGRPPVRDILVIDDDPQDARLVRRLLEATARYRVREYHSGESGWAALLEQRPDLIVLDLMLPDTSGEALLERLSQHAELRDIPVVVLTAKDIRASQREQLSSQIISMFQKGHLDRQALIDNVDETLGQG